MKERIKIILISIFFIIKTNSFFQIKILNKYFLFEIKIFFVNYTTSYLIK